MNTSLKKIVWALNPFDKDESIRRSTIHTLENLTKKQQLKVSPVYVAEFIHNMGPYTKSDFTELAKNHINKILKKYQNINFSEPEILVVDSKSDSEKAKLLDSFATKSKVDLMVLSSHGKKGLPRIFLGSFCETLLLSTKNPLIIVGPEAEGTNFIKNILLATDLKNVDVSAFSPLIRLSKMLQAKLTIFHAIVPSTQPAIQFDPLGAAFFSEELLENEKLLNEKAKALKLELSKIGINSEAVVITPELGIPAEIIKYSSERDFDLVALFSKSSRMEAAIFGSITRQIIREAKRPVWVQRAAG